MIIPTKDQFPEGYIKITPPTVAQVEPIVPTIKNPLTPKPTPEVKSDKYPYAAYVWNFLKKAGYNDHVVAGILGNMMVECGGLTLALQPEIENASHHYGICQWSNVFFPDIYHKPFEDQCEYLLNTIQNQFRVFGKNEFTYEQFLAIEDEQYAALVFAMYYERCSNVSYQKRKDCATIAYNEFAIQR